MVGFVIKYIPTLDQGYCIILYSNIIINLSVSLILNHVIRPKSKTYQSSTAYNLQLQCTFRSHLCLRSMSIVPSLSPLYSYSYIVLIATLVISSHFAPSTSQVTLALSRLLVGVCSTKIIIIEFIDLILTTLKKLFMLTNRISSSKLHFNLTYDLL